MNKEKTAQPIAHVKKKCDGSWCIHDLEEHLTSVAQWSSTFAIRFGASDWAHAAGLWHDIGKYSQAFQGYIRKASGYEAVDAHIEGGKGRVDHSTAGAVYAIERLGGKGRLLAYLIAGHHAGLPDWDTNDTGGAALSARLGEQNKELLPPIPWESIPKIILEAPAPEGRMPGDSDEARSKGMALWLRMLFSCLVDADFLDTEAFMDDAKTLARKGFDDLSTLKSAFDRHMETKAREAAPTTVNRIRVDVLRQCIQRAADVPGVFTLTVPTGGGKTLSSMAFALTHAVRYNKRRIIYAIPYTSIIEQTANVFREIFGDNVVEHHSQVDVPADRETHRSRLATENWDAPVIVTTNVQLFESLFAAKTSRCRKLHNIVDSIIVLDEAQLLPPEFLQPIVDALNLLVRHYGVTIVLSTATQPALQSREGMGWRFHGLDKPEEIMADPDVLYRDLRRTAIEMPADFQARRTWEDIAAELRTHESVLCIVNRRDDCRTLHRLMSAGCIHLSALMCGEHRARVIQEIKTRLSAGEPVQVISTQLVEAGVDLDFPVVYRAMAGLDSIAQAAGRCNREGRLARGRVVVFVPPSRAPMGTLRHAEETTISLLASSPLPQEGGEDFDPLQRHRFQAYFELFYARASSLDKYGIATLLGQDARQGKLQFRTAAALFKLIDDEAYRTVFVRYGDSPALLGQLENEGPARWLTRKLQRYAVNIPRKAFAEMLRVGDIKEIHPEVYVQARDSLYNPSIGFVVPDGVIAPDDLVI